MDFRLDNEQLALQGAVRAFCADRYPLDAIGSRDGMPLSTTRWGELLDLGAFSLLAPVADGTGERELGFVEAALVFEQFGQPIGSFQALKHMMADMFVRTALARSATYAAAAVLDDPLVGHVGRSIGAAKLLAGEAAIENARASVQVMGGMGFTWEMVPHYLLKRAWVLEQSFGTMRDHALGISALLASEDR